MLTPDELEQRRQAIEASPICRGSAHRLAARAAPVLARMPLIPSAEGGCCRPMAAVCPDDGTLLEFDRGAIRLAIAVPDAGTEWTGEKAGTHRDWARWQHLWVARTRGASRVSPAAFAGPATGDAAAGIAGQAAARAAEILRADAERYLDYPNQDNVLGPSGSSSTYPRIDRGSTNYPCRRRAPAFRRCASMTRRRSRFGRGSTRHANVIGEFDRAVLQPADLAQCGADRDRRLVRGRGSWPAARSRRRPPALGTHLMQGFGATACGTRARKPSISSALRGQLAGLAWARAARRDLMADPELASRLAGALRAPSRLLWRCPTSPFPRARTRASRSLAQPMYLELWEAGIADSWSGHRRGRRHDWLAGPDAAPSPAALAGSISYLHEAGEPAPAVRGPAISPGSRWAHGGRHSMPSI